MAKRQIFEYPGEILWYSRDIDWYLENDPYGLNKEICSSYINESADNKLHLEQLLNDSYRVAVAIAATKHREVYPVCKHLFNCYGKNSWGIAALYTGCQILSKHKNHSEFEKMIYDIEDIIHKSEYKNYYYIHRKIKFDLDLRPDMGSISKESRSWLLNELNDKEELEVVISFYRDKTKQMEFLEKFVHTFYVNDFFDFLPRFPMFFYYNQNFYLTKDEYQTLKGNVNKGMYLKGETQVKAIHNNESIDRELRDVNLVNDELKALLESKDMEIENWKIKAELAEETIKRCNNEISELKNEITSLKMKNEEWELLFAKGFAGCAVMEGDDAKVINSDAEREKEAYRKEIEEKSNKINNLIARLTKEMVSMSDIVGGFRRMSGWGERDDLVKVYNSLNTMLMGNEVWRKYTGEIESIFVQVNQNATTPSINYNYGPGANHYDSHTDLRINEDIENLLE